MAEILERMGILEEGAATPISSKRLAPQETILPKRMTNVNVRRQINTGQEKNSDRNGRRWRCLMRLEASRVRPVPNVLKGPHEDGMV